MKKLILSLAVMTSSAYAQVSPADVEQECVDQMALGICKVPLDRNMIAPGQTLLLSGYGKVQLSALADYTDKYNPSVPQDPAMCHLAYRYMTEEPGGDHDKIARSYWTPIPKAEPKPQSAASMAADAVLKAMGVVIASAAIAAAMGIAAATFFSIKRKVA